MAKSEAADEEYLAMSGIQHFCFCRRQWALIHIEQQWLENQRTAEGRFLHERCHDSGLGEKRGDLLVLRGMRVVSRRLRLSGECDVVEFRKDPGGVALHGYAGLWLPRPVEYKRGQEKESDADRLQLCAQAMALEEMLVCDIGEGDLYYGETRRRECVSFTPELRQTAASMAEEMNGYFRRGYTPKAKPGKHCNACSLRECCLPRLYARPLTREYIRSHIEEQG